MCRIRSSMPCYAVFEGRRVLVVISCLLSIAYRFLSLFLAACSSLGQQCYVSRVFREAEAAALPPDGTSYEVSVQQAPLVLMSFPTAAPQIAAPFVFFASSAHNDPTVQAQKLGLLGLTSVHNRLGPSNE